MRTQRTRTERASDRMLLFAGAVVAAVIGAIHLLGSGGFLQETPYLGVLFLLGGIGPIAAAVVMVVPRFAHLRRLAVVLTAVASLLMLVLGVVSRFTGLPGAEPGGWGPLFVISLVLEVVFVALTPRLLSASRR